MARMFNIYSVTDGIETFYKTVGSVAAGKTAHAELKLTDAEYIRCRDCLGGLRFEFNLKTGRKTA